MRWTVSLYTVEDGVVDSWTVNVIGVDRDDAIRQARRIYGYSASIGGAFLNDETE